MTAVVTRIIKNKPIITSGTLLYHGNDRITINTDKGIKSYTSKTIVHVEVKEKQKETTYESV